MGFERQLNGEIIVCNLLADLHFGKRYRRLRAGVIAGKLLKEREDWRIGEPFDSP